MKPGIGASRQVVGTPEPSLPGTVAAAGQSALTDNKPSVPLPLAAGSEPAEERYPHWRRFTVLGVLGAVLWAVSARSDLLPMSLTESTPVVGPATQHLGRPIALAVLIRVLGIYATLTGLSYWTIRFAHTSLAKAFRIAEAREAAYRDAAKRNESVMPYQKDFSNLPPIYVGLVESVLYPAALLAGRPEFAALWLGLKAAGTWQRWHSGGSYLGRALFNLFLITSALSLAFGALTFVLIWGFAWI